MTHTEWRDDYTRIVKGRADAYGKAADGFHLQMPFENVHGNGGLLTTVGDLLKWNRNFTTERVGGRALVTELQRRGRLSDGLEIAYARGLVVSRYRGVPEISHSGSTAGYRAFLTRYPGPGACRWRSSATTATPRPATSRTTWPRSSSATRSRLPSCRRRPRWTSRPSSAGWGSIATPARASLSA